MTNTGEIVSDAIKTLIEERQFIEKCNERIVAAHTGITEKRFRNCLAGQAEFKAEEIVNLAEYFGVSTDRILTGVEEKNRTVARDLGLTNDSIEYLKFINKYRDIPFTDAIFDEDYPGYVSGEGNSHLLIQKVVNLIFSTECGDNLLSAIGNFCFGNYDQGFPVFSDEINSPEDKTATTIDSVRFNVSGIREGYNISLGVMRFALMKAIENEIYMLRENAQREV